MYPYFSVRHQVRYPAKLTSKLSGRHVASFPGLGQVGVSIIFRCAAFGRARGSVASQNLPGPLPVFMTFRDTWDFFLRERVFRLPTMAEVLHCARSSQ